MSAANRHRGALILATAVWAMSVAVALITAMTIDGADPWAVGSYITVLTLVYAATAWMIRDHYRKARRAERTRQRAAELRRRYYDEEGRF